jgi:oligosaccharide translocation protein RFT1
MAAFSVIYIAFALLLYRFGVGDVSLVYANVINLLTRIVYCLLFISSYFKTKDAGDLVHWSVMFPRWKLLLASLSSALLILFSDRRLKVASLVAEKGRQAVLSPPVMLHIGIGGTLALLTLGTWWTSTRPSLTLPRRLKSE